MQSKYAIPFAHGKHLTTPLSATAAPITADVAMMRDESDGVERWRTWSAHGAKTDRQMAWTMNRVFVAIVLALSAWLVFQLLS
jgi:hypothetical protein